MTGDELSDFVNLQLFPTLKEKASTSQGKAGQACPGIRNIFEDAYNYMKSGTLMRQVINKICEINFNNTEDRHTFGSIYEQILKDLQSAGNAGEFYTPRAVTQFIVDTRRSTAKRKRTRSCLRHRWFFSLHHRSQARKLCKSAKDEEACIAVIHGVEKKGPAAHALHHQYDSARIDTPTKSNTTTCLASCL